MQHGDSIHSDPSTLELVRAAQAGDARSLEELFRRYLPRVRQIVAVRLRRSVEELEIVEDLVQETVLKALRGLDRFEQMPEATFRNWLSRCVQSAIVDNARRKKAVKRGGGKGVVGGLGQEGLASSIFAGDSETPSAIVEAKEAEKELEAAILGLDDHYREAIVLVKLCEMSYEDAAKLMGFRSPSSVRQLVFRAIRKLRQSLGAPDSTRSTNGGRSP